MNRYRLLRDLALNRDLDELAEEWSVSLERIHEIAEEEAEVIDEFREDIGRWLRGPEELWTTDKNRRIAEYQADVERINGLVETHGWDRGLQGEKTKLLRSIADELGHLPTRGSMASQEGKVVNYKFDGIDIDLEDIT